MASISANGSLGHHKFTLTVTESATSVENNTSTVKYTFQLSPVQTSWAWEQWGSSISYSFTINGTKYTGTIPNYDGYATVTLKSGSQTVTHNSDGSKSISYSFSVTDGAGQRYTPGNASASGTLALSTIPRATTPTLSATSVVANGTNAVTIKIVPASTSFKHKIRYSFGAHDKIASGVSIGTDFSAQGNVNITFTPPLSLCNQIPSKNSDTCTIYCYTYTPDGTLIGRTSVNLTLTVPSYTPAATAQITGNNLLSSAYVQGKSTVTINITASSSYGATIKSYSSTVDGKTYPGSKFTTSALTTGAKTLSVTVTDTRGKTATVKAPDFATVYAYANPSITGFTLERQTDGTTVIATVKGTISAINNKNAKTITVTLNGVTQTITSSSYTINGTTTFTDVPTDNTLTGTAKLTDSYTDATKDFVLPTVAVTMDFHHSGKGIAMGKVAETEGLFEVAWDSRFNKAVSIKTPALESLSITRTDSGNGAAIKFANKNGVLGYVGMSNNANGGLIRWTHDAASSHVVLDTGNTKNYIVEQGTSGVWTYRKWNSGFAECYGYHTVSGLNISTAWGSWYASPAIALPSFPFTFVGAPDVHVEWESDFSAIKDGVGKRESTKAGQVYLYRPVAQTNVNGRFSIYAYGKWK